MAGGSIVRPAFDIPDMSDTAIVKEGTGGAIGRVTPAHRN